MISSAIVKEQLDAYLDKLIPPRKQRGKVREASRIDPDALAKLVEDHMKKLRDLVDSECKKMFVDYARDVSMTLDGVLRCFINFCQNPEGGIDTEKIGSSYGNLREMFMEKYRSFFSSEFEEADSVFFSLSATLEEMKAESLSLHQRLASSIIAQPEINKNSTKTETTSTKETTPAPSLQPEKKVDSSQKSEGGWISRLMNRFKPSGEAYVKCNTGKDSSGMRYDPVKKR